MNPRLLVNLSRHADRKATLKSDEAEIGATQRGRAQRTASVAMPAITANGVTRFGIPLVPEGRIEITSIRVAYSTPPVSAAGTLVLDVKKVSGGVTTLIQNTAGFDLEGLTAEVPQQLTNLHLAKATRVCQKNDYLYAEITSDNVDADSGIAGVLVVTYKVFE